MKNNVKNFSRRGSLQSTSELLSRIYDEILKHRNDGRNSILLQRLLKALRAVMNSKDYSLDAGLVLSEIDKHPETANRTLELLCPLKEYTQLKMLFNYDDLLSHIEKYLQEIPGKNSFDLADEQNLMEKDLRILKNNLSEFLSKEREIKYWGRQVNWNKNVKISIPTRIVDEKRLDNDPEKKTHSLEEESSTVILDDSNDILRVVLLVLDTGTSEKNQHHFNKCLFRIELEPKQSRVEKKVRIILIDRYSKVNFSFTSKSNSDEYWTRRILRGIPLHIENGGKGLCVYSVTQISAISSKVSRWYLHANLNENGRKKIKLIEGQIYKIQSDASMETEVKTEKLEHYQQKKNSIINKRQYQILTVKIKGLLLYSLLESDERIFIEIIHNLSKYNKYDETYFGLHYNNEDLFRNLSNEDQTEKMDFPFLLDYDKFSDALPPGFAFNVLKGIARELLDKLEITPVSKLKFEVTSRFLKALRDYLWTLQLFGDRRIDLIDGAKFRTLCNYHTVIGSYVRRKKEMLSKVDDIEWTEEMKHNRFRLQERRFSSLVRNNDDVTNPIIPIIEERKAVEYTDLLSILKNLALAYDDRYVVCESCLIAKRKASELRSLLLSLISHHPHDATLTQVIQSLITEGGLPKCCIDTNRPDLPDILNKLGFRIKTKRQMVHQHTLLLTVALEDPSLDA